MWKTRIFRVIGLICIILGIRQSYGLIGDSSSLNEFGKGYLSGSIILIIFGALFIYLSIQLGKQK